MDELVADTGAGRAVSVRLAPPFGALLQALGLTLVLGWGAATLCWTRGWRSAFVPLLAVAGMITALILQLLNVVEPHHSAKEISIAITALAL